MSVLGNLFGKDEINHLKGELVSKSNEVEKVNAELARLKLEIDNISSQFREVTQEKDAIVDARNILMVELTQRKIELELLTNEFEIFKKTNLDQQEQLRQTILDLQSNLTILAPSVAAANAERDAKSIELQNLRAAYDEKDSIYLERESKLAQKSEKLLLERQKFQQQATDLHNREQHWKHVVEPQILKYESHLSLDLRKMQLDERQVNLDYLDRSITEREADMLRRQIVDQALTAREVEISEWNQLLSDRAKDLKSDADGLDQKKANLDTLSKSLEVKSLELSKFRSRVEQLDEVAAQLRIRAENIQFKEDAQILKHEERLADLRIQRAEIRRIKKEFNLREEELKEREKIVKREESSLLNFKNKNFELRNEKKRLDTLLHECEELKKVESRSNNDLQRENETLKARIQELIQANKKVKPENKSKESNEVDIGEYDPAKHGGEIAPPPPAFRSNTPLTALHYHVGLSGIDDQEERRELLRSIISCSYRQLPKVGSTEYMRQWGEGKSPQRVRCMAYHLSWNIGFQGAKDTNELARQHWLEDLKWLTKHYKLKIPGSMWPKVPKF
jgi:hypothetical protein